MSKRGKVDFIFQRDGSTQYWIKLRSPGVKRIERSLGTPDRQLAEVLAAPLVAEHKRLVLEARPRIEATWRHDYAPGLHVNPDGGQIFATARELHYLDAQGATIRMTTNGGPAFVLSSVPRLGLNFPVPIQVTDAAARPVLAVKGADDAYLETYLKHANVTGYYEREARHVWALYKSLTDSKRLKDSTRDDGRKLVTYFEGQGLKSASIKKKIGWLTSAVNLAISEGRLAFNPFSSIIPRKKDAEKRLPLDDADIEIIKARLDGLSDSDQVLLRLLGCTGMRLSEAFEIAGEKIEQDVRYIIIGSKTPQSLRRVPLPEGILAHLPKLITSKLFQGDELAASKRLNRFLRAAGITDPHKVIYSLRHRAKDRLRAAWCPLDVQLELLGHETKTVAAGYGHGSPVALLRQWADKIGF